MSKPLNLRAAESEIYRETSGQGWALGTRMYTPSGRIFRRAKAGTTALGVGTLMRKVENEAAHANLAVAAAVNVNTKIITLTLTSIGTTFDEYKDGLIYINDVTGQGYVYEINGNTLTDKAGTCTVNITASEGVEVALTTSSEATLIKNRYNGVTICETTPSETSVGLTPAAVTASYYFWLQTGGPGAVLQDGTLYENRGVAPSVVTKGAGMVARVPIGVNGDSDTSFGYYTAEALITDAEYNERVLSVNAIPGLLYNNVVGYSLDPRTSTEFSLIALTLESG